MKKGFTLIELIGVILIITLIFALAYPSFVKIISTNNERALQSQI
ncbi:MAG: prepilin-type N-terminal cleavage/methylation domain-containing protein, partial [Bacilli bacterium]|nr:prepilin-type N-terminal cleavage/methylation domain-containing protein [Bacilli bacterium]